MATATDIYQSISDLVGKYSVTRDNFISLLGLPANGGPNNDGYFVATIADGSTVLAPSLAKVIQLTTISNLVPYARLDGSAFTGAVSAPTHSLTGATSSYNVNTRDIGATWQIFNTAGVLQFYNTANMLTLGVTGALTAAGALSVGGDITASRIDGTAAINLGSTATQLYGTSALITASKPLLVSGDIFASGGDLKTSRPGNASGALYFGTSGAKYLYFDGTNFTLNGGHLNLNGNLIATGSVSTSLLSAKQLSNSSADTIVISRYTDTAPAGNFLRGLNAASNTELFHIDTTGAFYTAGTIISNASITLNSNATVLGFRDASGTSPYFACQGDNNFIFAGTDGAGSGRVIWSVVMRNSTSAFNFGVPVTMAGTLGVTGALSASNFSGSHTGSSSGTNAGDETSSTILSKLSAASGGGTVNFLRADGTWTTPAGAAGSFAPLAGAAFTGAISGVAAYTYTKSGSLLTAGSGGQVQSITEGAAGDVFYWGREYSGTKAAGAAAGTNYAYGPAGWQFDLRTDTADVGGDFVRTFYGRTIFGTSAAKGGRIGLLGEVYHALGPTAATNGNRNYVGVVGQANVDPPAAGVGGDGGTNTGAGAKGAYFGLNGVVRLGANCTNVFEASGCEFNTYIKASASARYTFGATIAGFNEIRGAELDGALEIGGGTDSGYGPHVGWKFGIVFSNIHGGNPTASDSILLGSYWSDSTPRTILHGIDLSGFTITGALIQGRALSMTESTITMGANGSNISTITAGNGVTNGTLALIAKGTGSVNLYDGNNVPRVLVDSGAGVRFAPKSSAAPTANGELAIEATSNTSLTFRFKGSDGVVRSGSITLA